ncbi:cah [Symbiodinium necroappetens]|uniref:Cah protein n=1 Tax=Symbiodinium necroappetens TaxID=1628268 RepID=A0A812V6C5_9DINO|nr:cah [Symbiodinium necroappetens]
MASLYPSLRSPLLPGPQSPGTQAAQALKDGVQRRLLSCQLEDLICAGTDTRSTPKPLVTELTKEPAPPGLLKNSIDGQRGRPTERIVRDIEERKASLRKVAKHSWNPTTDLEPSLEERPLLLLGDFTPKDGLKKESEAGNCERKILLWDEGRRCFASHWPGALASSFCSYAFDLLMQHGPWEALHSKKGQVTRETCWYVRAGCRCDYTYGIARVRAKKKPSATFRAAMETLLEEVMSRVCPGLPKDAWPNCANLNLYTEAWQSVGWHADDESLFMGRDRDCPIVSVSLGARREFWLALRHENCMDPQLKSIVEVDLCDGDVLTMEGLCQKHCVHFVPCDVRNVTPHPWQSDGRARINVTWRWIRDHKQRCPRRAADGDNATDFYFEKQGQVPSEKKALFAHSWAGGRALAWRSCQECDHDAWKGGRNCLKYQKQWLCRPCYEYMLTGGPPRERLQPPRQRGQRRPDISMIRARALQAEAVEEGTRQVAVKTEQDFYKRTKTQCLKQLLIQLMRTGMPLRERCLLLGNCSEQMLRHTCAYSNSYKCSTRRFESPLRLAAGSQSRCVVSPKVRNPDTFQAAPRSSETGGLVTSTTAPFTTFDAEDLAKQVGFATTCNIETGARWAPPPCGGGSGDSLFYLGFGFASLETAALHDLKNEVVIAFPACLQARCGPGFFGTLGGERHLFENSGKLRLLPRMDTLPLLLCQGDEVFRDNYEELQPNQSTTPQDDPRTAWHHDDTYDCVKKSVNARLLHVLLTISASRGPVFIVTCSQKLLALPLAVKAAKVVAETEYDGSWRQDHALQMLAVPTQPHMPERADVIALDVILRSLRELLGQSQAEINMTQTQKWTQRNEHLSAGRGIGERLGPFAAWSLAAQTVNVTLHPGPLTWEVKLVNPEAIVVQIGGLDYSLQSMSFKSPSEHTVEGAHNGMEIQMRHVAKSPFGGGEKVLMVSISLRLAENVNVGNAFLSPIFSTMPLDGQGAPSVFIANPYLDLAPPDKSYVRYSGSTTAPPCEHADWIVFMEPGYLGFQQLEQFRSSISGYQPSRLAPANSTPPLGVSEAWDSRWGRNNRLAQDLEFREVQMIQMMNVDASAVPKLTAFTGMAGNASWQQLNIYWIIALTLLVLACVICGVWLLRAQLFHEEEYPTGMYGRELRSNGCCEVSVPAICTTSGAMAHASAILPSTLPRAVQTLGTCMLHLRELALANRTWDFEFLIPLRGFSDVIVNSANETLEGPLFPYFPIGAECESGDVYYQDDVVDGRIHKAGGPALGRLCRRLPELPPEDDPDGPFPSPYTQRCEIGGARLTKVPEGGELVQHCQYVAHAVVPIWAGDLDLEEQNQRLSLLTKAYASAFAAAASSSSPVLATQCVWCDLWALVSFLVRVCFIFKSLRVVRLGPAVLEIEFANAVS